jgi:hypothetical protein
MVVAQAPSVATTRMLKAKVEFRFMFFSRDKRSTALVIDPAIYLTGTASKRSPIDGIRFITKQTNKMRTCS